jgi:hypothetical protein
MEILKKTIQQIMTTGKTTSCNKNCYVIIPDITIFYNFKICLTQEAHDFGFFDAYVPETTTTSLLGT